jgi:hypothetical protein
MNLCPTMKAGQHGLSGRKTCLFRPRACRVWLSAIHTLQVFVPDPGRLIPGPFRHGLPALRPKATDSVRSVLNSLCASTSLFARKMPTPSGCCESTVRWALIWRTEGLKRNHAKTFRGTCSIQGRHTLRYEPDVGNARRLRPHSITPTSFSG